jgi:uncharacterized protein YcbK (DUF882 family)
MIGMPKMCAMRVSAALFLMLGVAAFDAPNAHAKVTSVTEKTASSSPKGKSKGRRSRGRFDGHAVADAELRQAPLPRPSGHIVISTAGRNEAADVNIYNDDGSFDQDALAQLDHLFRCRKTDEERAMDPRLYEILSLIYDHFGQPISINSGFRYQRNEGSRHFHGSAMDITVNHVGYRELYAYANTLDRGGMGIGRYPTTGFVHIDFRAPGEGSYRWTDTHGSSNSDPGKMPSRMWKRSSKPNT